MQSDNRPNAKSSEGNEPLIECIRCSIFFVVVVFKIVNLKKNVEENQKKFKNVKP